MGSIFILGLVIWAWHYMIKEEYKDVIPIYDPVIHDEDYEV